MNTCRHWQHSHCLPLAFVWRVISILQAVTVYWYCNFILRLHPEDMFLCGNLISSRLAVIPARAQEQEHTHTHTHSTIQHKQFPNRCRWRSSCITYSPPPPSSCPSRLSKINASESGFRDVSDVFVCERSVGRGVANNQQRYTNLRWQHLVYLKLKGQLY